MEPATPGAQVDIILAYSFNKRKRTSERFRKLWDLGLKFQSAQVTPRPNIICAPPRSLYKGNCGASGRFLAPARPKKKMWGPKTRKFVQNGPSRHTDLVPPQYPQPPSG